LIKEGKETPKREIKNKDIDELEESPTQVQTFQVEQL
jgi:hypothetical protein